MTFTNLSNLLLCKSGRYLSCLIAVLLTGCIGLIPSPFRPSPGPQKAPQAYDLAEAFDIVCRNYRLGPQDGIRVLYQAEWSVPYGSFTLDTLDELEIKFILDPQLNEKVVVRPDGMITLQGVGDVQAAALSPDELARKIENKYIEAEIFTKDETRAALKNYKLVTVHVNNFYQKIQRLIAALQNLTTGSANAVTVNPDGTIDLPLLTERILAAGHTVVEVENTANRLYRAGPLKHVVASFALYVAASRKVYVLGEVKNPGAYDIKQPVTALHALAMAGGHNSLTADLTSVILISRNIHGKPIGRRLDLKRILDVGDMGSAILVKPYDVLFVPNTYIQDVNIFMDQYLAVVGRVAALSNALRGN